MNPITHIRLARTSIPALALALGLIASTPARAEVETFSIDTAHSFANWELRHVIARTSGTFHDIKGTVVIDKSNLANSSVNALISIYSLNSSHLRRDLHTLSEEFLNARDFPEMKFNSTSVNPISAERGTLSGQLTLHGVTKPVTMDYQILGFAQDPWGGMRTGLKASTRINRSDFGITKFTPTGPVGNEVDISLLIEGIKLGPDGQPWNAKAAAAEKAKVISYPMPTPPTPQAAAIPAPQVAPAAEQPAVASPSPAPAETPKQESTEDQLKRKLKGLFR